ncbi:MAG: hypothetical protein JXQ83_11900, partial [Candidatus Glassbacteria bacterium]|nr:hypothetical protein [Candidatus Glassbacteria bacterium]
MKKICTGPVLPAAVLIFLLSVQSAPAFSFKAPSGVKLPLAASLVDEGPARWERLGDTSRLTGRGPGLVEFPAWWSGNRPPRGEMAMLEIEYLDNLAHPAVAEVYSGMATRDDFFELHRFGGTGDNTWKTARVPCPADLMFLCLPNRSLRFRVSSESGLEVRAARLTAPAPGDEERYNRETRDWVRREQTGRARIDSVYYTRAQAPVLPGEWASRALV